MQFEYRRPESSMLITEQNIAVSFARCLPFVLITTCHSLVTRLSIITTACQRYGVSYRVSPNQWCDYRNCSIKILYMVGSPFWFGIVGPTCCITNNTLVTNHSNSFVNVLSSQNKSTRFTRSEINILHDSMIISESVRMPSMCSIENS